jgi:hypothetical protein
VWDDRDIVSWASAGGTCITPEEAAQVLAADPAAEEVTITASSDGNVTGACLVAGCGRAGRDRQMLGLVVVMVVPPCRADMAVAPSLHAAWTQWPGSKCSRAHPALTNAALSLGPHVLLQPLRVCGRSSLQYGACARSST